MPTKRPQIRPFSFESVSFVCDEIATPIKNIIMYFPRRHRTIWLTLDRKLIDSKRKHHKIHNDNNNKTMKIEQNPN